MSHRVEHLAEGVTLHLGDCLEILPALGRFDACVTDPPYGIGESAKKNLSRGLLAAPRDYGCDDWDRKPCPPEVLKWVQANTRWQIIFGGNFFDLPPAPCWLVWDKENNGDFADAELAWTNMRRGVRLVRWMWNGMIRRGGEERVHLTQKPLGVMEWCFAQLPKVESSIDPFMGSGTTGVASVRAGVSFTGIEISPKYFDIACRRISDALARPDMFVAKTRPVEVQEAFL